MKINIFCPDFFRQGMDGYFRFRMFIRQGFASRGWFPKNVPKPSEFVLTGVNEYIKRYTYPKFLKFPKNVIYTHRYIYSFGFIKFLTKNVFGTTVLFLPSGFQFKSIFFLILDP